jgi:hypothetical protein
MKDGTGLYTEGGAKKFSAEHVLVHELGHAIVDIIMDEYEGKFNDINFKELTKEEQLDWAIRFTNTILEDMNKDLETGQIQHGRKSDEKPDEEQVAPLTE